MRVDRLRARRIEQAGIVLFVAALVVVFGLIGRALAATFQIGFHVETTHPTNVVAGYRLTCSNATTTKTTAERFEAVTPFTSTIAQNLAHPTRCSLRVVAWDVPPWHAHYHGQRPVVTSWVRS